MTIKQKLDWSSEIAIQHICAEIVEADLNEDDKRHTILKANRNNININMNVD